MSVYLQTHTDDINTIFSVAAKDDDNDCYSRKNIDTNSKNYGVWKRGFKFGVPQSDQLSFFENDLYKNAFKNSIERLVKLGGEKIEIDFSPFLNAAKLLYTGPWVAERQIATESLLNTKPESMLPIIHKIVTSQKDTSAADTFKSLYQLQTYKKIADSLINDVDFILTPTTGTHYTQEQVSSDPINLNSNLGFYTNYMNLLDYSCIACPADILDNGLPFGISFVGKAFDDTKLTSIAKLWMDQAGISIGATDWKYPPSNITDRHGTLSKVEIAVCGAHLEGLPLNFQLLDRDATLIKKTNTSKSYRFYALAGGPPYRPGLIRDEENGEKIEIEIWQLPTAGFGSFVANIPPPLGIGKVETESGEWITSFICEGYAIETAEDITRYGSWRNFLENN